MDVTSVLCPGDTSKVYRTGLWRQGKKPVWDAKKCKHCFSCVNDCPEDCILRTNGKVSGINYYFCKGCGICAEMCPFKALTMVEDRE